MYLLFAKKCDTKLPFLFKVFSQACCHSGSLLTHFLLLYNDFVMAIMVTQICCPFYYCYHDKKQGSVNGKGVSQLWGRGRGCCYYYYKLCLLVHYNNLVHAIWQPVEVSMHLNNFTREQVQLIMKLKLHHLALFAKGNHGNRPIYKHFLNCSSYACAFGNY